MRRLSKINESVFGKVVKRSDGKEVRTEEETVILQNKFDDFMNRHYRYGLKYQIKNKMVYCDEDVKIYEDDLIDGKLPFQFGDVNGDFYCNDCENLISLVGSPQKVGKTFCCMGCGITSLNGSPKEVGGNFYCSKCKGLTSLEGAPQKVGKVFYCDRNDNLISLEGATQEVGGFSCSHCSGLKTLKGSPQKVSGNFHCNYCKNITSLEGCPQEVGMIFACKGCSITSLDGCPQIIRLDFYCGDCGKKFYESDLPEGVELKGNFYNK